MSEAITPEPVYYHNCKALGPNTKIIKALLADKSGEYILCYYHKCPFCSATAGERELAPGVSLSSDGSYLVDTAVAKKMH
jgi:hypothetical protein